METTEPAKLHPEKPSCQPGTSISDGMRKISQITIVLTESRTVLAVAPTFCVTYIPEKLKKAMLNMVRQTRRTGRHCFPTGQIHRWSLQKGRLGREPSPGRRASSQREQEVWRGWQNPMCPPKQLLAGGGRCTALTPSPHRHPEQP